MARTGAGAREQVVTGLPGTADQPSPGRPNLEGDESRDLRSDRARPERLVTEDEMTHVIVLPGGGYSTLAPHEAEPIVVWLRSLGYDASVLKYPLHARHPLPLLAVRDRVRDLRNGGESIVGVAGFSAGGHLAGHAALTSSGDERVDFAVLGYAITSMELNSYKPSQDILLGPSPAPLLRRETTLEHLVTAAAPPFFLWHTAEDIYVPAEHTHRLAAALSRRNIPHTTYVFPHGPHSLGLARGRGMTSIWTALAADWIADVLAMREK